MKLSIIIPAKNESSGLKGLLPELLEKFSSSEIIVVNDGSSDNTSDICKDYNVREVKHLRSIGNGGAIKSGARAASGDVFAFMDGDGQHSVGDLEKLILEYRRGHDMVVGARKRNSQASFVRLLANSFYNRLSSWMVGSKISDLTSGLRVVNAEKFLDYLYLLPNGFSYPTTITMAFFKSGYSVSYVDIIAGSRKGKSHISLTKDGIRFLLIIFKIGTLYSPIKIFFPISIMLFCLGAGYYAYTYSLFGRFTNMGMMLFTTSLIIFLMGLISEQITTLLYSNKK